MDTGTQELTLNRMIFTDKSTQGELWIDGKRFCFTLEPTCRKGPKVAGETAIPAGRYQIKIGDSPKFGRSMPYLLNVPNFEGIMIHWGNLPTDTHGCILVGQMAGPDYVGESKMAYEKLWPVIVERTREQALYISVLGSRSA